MTMLAISSEQALREMHASDLQKSKSETDLPTYQITRAAAKNTSAYENLNSSNFHNIPSLFFLSSMHVYFLWKNSQQGGAEEDQPH